MDLVIGRTESSMIGDNWTLLYGRRKTGKTYILNRFFHPDLYVRIEDDGIIVHGEKTIRRFLKE